MRLEEYGLSFDSSKYGIKSVSPVDFITAVRTRNIYNPYLTVYFNSEAIARVKVKAIRNSSLVYFQITNGAWSYLDGLNLIKDMEALFGEFVDHGTHFTSVKSVRI